MSYYYFSALFLITKYWMSLVQFNTTDIILRILCTQCTVYTHLSYLLFMTWKTWHFVCKFNRFFFLLRNVNPGTWAKKWHTFAWKRSSFDMYYQYGNTGYGVTSRGYTIFARFLPKNQHTKRNTRRHLTQIPKFLALMWVSFLCVVPSSKQKLVCKTKKNT